MHIFSADIYPLCCMCGFDLKYDTSCSKILGKKIDHKPNKYEALEGGSCVSTKLRRLSQMYYYIVESAGKKVVLF